MKYRAIIASLLCFYFFENGNPLHAQLTNPSACGLNLPITDNNCPDGGIFYDPDEFTINVNNAPGTQLGTDVYLKEVRLTIRHPWVSDLDISLVSPSGKLLRLSFDNGGGDDNYGDPDDPNCFAYAAFTAAACESITEGQAPFIDKFYRPEESLLLFNDNITNPNGQWTLQICDDIEDDIGTLEFVELVFEPISCLPIIEADIAGVDTTTVLLNWSPSNACANTIIEYGLPGFVPGTTFLPGQGTVVTTNLCPPYALQGLAPETEYDIYIRKYCPISNSFSDNTCSVRAKTGCLPPPITIVENFDGYTTCSPSCGAVCNFTGIWRNQSSDNFDWIVYSGATPTADTGPEDDVKGGGKYVYLEASGVNCTNGKIAYLVSNCIEIDKKGADSCHLSFNYHLFGSNIGRLRLEASTDGGFTWSSLWEKIGDQGNNWHKVYLSLRSFADGSIVRFRFVAVGGNGSKGDIALDNIVFFGSINRGQPDIPFYVDADNDGFGNSSQFILSCSEQAQPGFTTIGGDCNDNDPLVNPNATEVPCDNIDNNCNGTADDAALPPVAVTHDTICTGEQAVLCATANFNRPIFWYNSPTGNDFAGFGTCLFPNLPANNSPVPVVYKFYAEESDFSCKSVARTEAVVVVNPSPEVSTAFVPEICQGQSFDLASIPFEDLYFTGASITFHLATPATAQNQLPTTLVSPTSTTNYYFLATTQDGCTDEGSIAVFAKPGTSLTFDPGSTTAVCKETSEVITANATGGAAPYQYLWSNGDADAQIVVNAAPVTGAEEKYFVTVTDAQGCTKTDSVLVRTTSSIQAIQVSSQDVSTCSGTNGKIMITPLDGTPPYSYIWSSDNGTSGASSNINGTFSIDNLRQGAYRITITDSSPQPCEFFLRQVFVNGPSARIVQSATQDVSCNGAADGSISVTASGGNPQFLWSNGATMPTIQNLSGGLYSLTLTDGFCQTTYDFEIKEPEPLKIIPKLGPPSCAERNDGNIDLMVFGGTKNYIFNWSNGSRREDLEAVLGGTYRLTITDAKGCQLKDTLFLDAPAPLGLAIDSIKTLRCNGTNDGYIKVQAGGGTAPYQYKWNTGSTAPVIANLAAGQYTITVNDFNDCQVILPIDMTQPDSLRLSLLSKTDPQCIGDETGHIEVAATGGTMPYRFDWDNGAVGALLDNVGVGTYLVYLTDANNCLSDTLPFTLSATSPIAINAVVNEPACIGRTDGTIFLQPIGSAPFTFNWERGDMTQNINNVGVGAYAVTITDAQGCFLDTLIGVNAPQTINLNIGVLQPTCFQSADARIDVTVINVGTPPLRYQWNNGSTSQDLSGLNDGNYLLTALDAAGCAFVSDTILIKSPEKLALEVETLGQIACAGDATGFIEVGLEGGTKPYAYQWSGGIIATTEDIFNLPSGEYRLLIKDANNCPIDTTFVLEEPTTLDVDVSIRISDVCETTFSNEIKAIANGGLPPYKYSWSNGETSATLTNVPPGDYQLSVEDANACTETIASVKVRDGGKALAIDTVFVEDISCFGAKDGSMSVIVSGGNPPFQFHFSNNEIFTTSNRSVSINNLALDDDYSVTITDLNSGCRVISPKFAVKEPLALSWIRDQVNVPNCFNGFDGSILTTTYGGRAPFAYQWYDQNNLLIGTSEDLKNIKNGLYTGYLSDATGCKDTLLNILVENDNEPIRYASPPIIQNARCKGNSDGKINISLSGGAPPFDYNWSNGATTEDLSNLSAGSYSLTLTDRDTCRVIFPPIMVTEPAAALAIVGKANPVKCFGGKDGSIEVLVSGGTLPYDLIWEFNGALFTEDTTNLTGLMAGIYTLTVQDSNQCVTAASFEITQPPKLVVQIDIASTTATAIAAGGVPDYDYLWNTGETTASILIPAQGSYSVTVTDLNNCTAASDITVSTYNVEFIKKARLFPNPTTGRITLDYALFKSLHLEVEITSLAGQKVLRRDLGKIQAGQATFDLGAFPSGLYMVHLFTEGKPIYVARIILQ